MGQVKTDTYFYIASYMLDVHEELAEKNIFAKDWRSRNMYIPNLLLQTGHMANF